MPVNKKYVEVNMRIDLKEPKTGEELLALSEVLTDAVVDVVPKVASVGFKFVEEGDK